MIDQSNGSAIPIRGGFAPKVGPAGTEPLAVASGIKTQPTVITAMRHELEIKIQSKFWFLLASLSRSLPRAVLYQEPVSFQTQGSKMTFEAKPSAASLRAVKPFYSNRFMTVQVRDLCKQVGDPIKERDSQPPSRRLAAYPKWRSQPGTATPQPLLLPYYFLLLVCAQVSDVRKDGWMAGQSCAPILLRALQTNWFRSLGRWRVPRPRTTD